MSRIPPSEDPFSGISFDLSDEIPTISTKPESFGSAIATGAQVIAASASWAIATNSSASIIDSASVLSGLKSLRPSMISSGLPAMFAYNFIPVEIAIEAQKKVLGQEDNPSNFKSVLSVLAGAGTEAAVGNPLDFLSLRQILHSVKIKHHLQNNPEAFAKFSHEELQKLLPANIKTAIDKEAILKSAAESKYSNISFTPQNLKMFNEKLGIKLTLKDVAKSLAIMYPTSMIRNIPFYVGLLEANKPKSSSIYETMLISLSGALITTIPNNATYQAAIGVIKGEEPMQVFTSALSTSAKQIWQDPKKLAALVGIRSMATLAAICCFSDSTHDNIKHLVDSISDTVSRQLGFEEHQKLTEAQKAAIDVKLTETLSNPKVAEIVSKKLQEVNFSDHETKALEAKKPDTAPANPQNEKLASATKGICK